MYRIIYSIVYWVFRPQTEMSKIKGLENLPKKEGFILVANHQNSHDPLILAVALKKWIFGQFWPRKVYFIGSLNLKKQWFRYTLISVILNLFGEKIGYLTADRPGLRKALAALQKGNGVVIFPEGRRNSTQILSKGKKGAAVLALLSGKKIIPVGCFGPATFWLGQITGFFKRKWVILGKPFSFLRVNQREIDQNPEILIKVTNRIMQKLACVCGKNFLQ